MRSVPSAIRLPSPSYHFTVGEGMPLPTHLKVAVSPSLTRAFLGGTVIVGATVIWKSKNSKTRVSKNKTIAHLGYIKKY